MSDCAECTDHTMRHGWALVHACASVGIEHGRSTQQTFARYIADYHQSGHPQRFEGAA